MSNKSSTVEQNKSVTPNADNIVEKARVRKWYEAQAGQKPKDVNGQLATRTAFYKRELEKIIKSIFLVDCSLDWDVDYILFNIIHIGYIVISKTETAGVLPIYGTLTGINYIGLPTTAVMASPILGNWENTIGVDCELVYLERRINRVFYNFQQNINIYAQRLASADSAIDTNLFNSKIAYMAEAENKQQADTIKALMNNVSNGDPLVVYRKGSVSPQGMQLFFNNVKNTYIADIVQDTKRSIMNEFLTSIGVNNANTDKKERLVTSEVDANNIELSANVDHFKFTLDRQNQKIRRIFPEIQWNMELRYDIEKMTEMAKAVADTEPKGGENNDNG